MMLDEIPLWFAIPATIVLWIAFISPMFFDIAEDTSDDLSHLDRLDRGYDRPRR